MAMRDLLKIQMSDSVDYTRGILQAIGNDDSSCFLKNNPTKNRDLN